MSNNVENENLFYRKPEREDGLEIYKLVESSPPLDLNSVYYYLIFCTHFKDTSIIVEYKGKIVGFISAYIKPGDENTLFVWQVAVSSDVRGKKVGKTMLGGLVKRDSKINYLETTVTPSNEPSKALFRSFAKQMTTQCTENVFFEKELFGKHGHEEEILFRIGPFK